MPIFIIQIIFCLCLNLGITSQTRSKFYCINILYSTGVILTRKRHCKDMEKNGEFPASDEDVKNKRKHYSQFSMKEMELQKLTEI